MKQINKYSKSWIGRGGQRGGMTIFSAALILILMTMVLVYATRVSIFESRISGNEVRQKEAFHVAEAALEQNVMYLLSNANVLLSSREDAFPDGTAGSFGKDGWFATGNTKWYSCAGKQGTPHPCGGDVLVPNSAFYFDDDGDLATIDSLPVNQSDFPTGSTARINALMCVVDLNTPTGECLPDIPVTAAEEANSRLVITLLAYGYSDCTDIDKISTCTGEATIAMPLSTFKQLSGAPALPLVAKGTVPLDGTFEVVGNPNGGGVGVPLTTWVESIEAQPPIPGPMHGDAIAPPKVRSVWSKLPMSSRPSSASAETSSPSRPPASAVTVSRCESM